MSLLERDIRFRKEQELVSNLYVMKFGGTSVGNADAIAKTAGFIDYHARSGVPIIVVVSAMSGVTKQLGEMYRLVSNRNMYEAREELGKIRQRHTETVGNFNIPSLCRLDITDELDFLFSDLYRDMQGCIGSKPDELDRILSYGERLSARLLAGFIRTVSMGKTEVIDAHTIIQTDDIFNQATVDMEASRSKVQNAINPLLRNGILPIITGFIGATTDGKITTLGSNTSDYSATMIGNLMHAKEVWICKEVNGIFKDDPNINPDAEMILSMSHEQAGEFLDENDKVLCRKALDPIMGTNIIVRVRHSGKPTEKGTAIYPPSLITDENGVK